jgi:hypothetical protein
VLTFNEICCRGEIDRRKFAVRLRRDLQAMCDARKCRRTRPVQGEEAQPIPARECDLPFRPSGLKDVLCLYQDDDITLRQFLGDLLRERSSGGSREAIKEQLEPASAHRIEELVGHLLAFLSPVADEKARALAIDNTLQDDRGETTEVAPPRDQLQAGHFCGKGRQNLGGIDAPR